MSAQTPVYVPNTFRMFLGLLGARNPVWGLFPINRHTLGAAYSSAHLSLYLRYDSTMQIKNFITPLFAGIAWLVGIILFAQLLSGTFETRSCTTACVQTLYWIALVVAGTGWLLGAVLLPKMRNAVTIISMAALTGLLGIFVVMMFIGTFL